VGDNLAWLLNDEKTLHERRPKMVRIYKNQQNNLATIKEAVPGCWIDVVDPTQQERDYLIALGVPQDYLTYSLDPDERARTERDGSVLILMRVPDYQGEKADIPFTTITLGIILTGEYLITVCKREIDILEKFSSGLSRGFSTSKHYRFVLQILLTTASDYLTHLRQITRRVDVLEDQLQLSTRNKEVLELLKYQKSLTVFTTALKSNELMLKRLQQNVGFKTYPEDEELLEDVLTETQQAIEMTNIESNILSSMMDAFASIISNNLNGVMKFLASITIILSLPTMIASFYGMNVKLPLANHVLAFPITLIVSLAITTTAAVIFWRHDWL
jgi:magnesium transporter